MQSAIKKAVMQIVIVTALIVCNIAYNLRFLIFSFNLSSLVIAKSPFVVNF